MIDHTTKILNTKYVIFRIYSIRNVIDLAHILPLSTGIDITVNPDHFIILEIRNKMLRDLLFAGTFLATCTLDLERAAPSLSATNTHCPRDWRRDAQHDGEHD